MVDLVKEVKETLDKIQQNLFDVAKQKRDASIQVAKTWDEFTAALGEKKLILAPWCDEQVITVVNILSWHNWYSNASVEKNNMMYREWYNILCLYFISISHFICLTSRCSVYHLGFD